MDDCINAKQGSERAASPEAACFSGLRRIIADLDVYFERVEKAVASYREPGRKGEEECDPVAIYVKGVLAAVETAAFPEEALSGRRRKEAENIEPLNANHFVEDVVVMLRKIVKRRARLRAEPADGDVRIMVNREKMDRVFASIVAYGMEIVRRGGTITILARLLPLRSGLSREGGCALLSVISDDVAGKGKGRECRPKVISKGAARRAFAAIRAIIGEHHGSISVIRKPGKARFNIYLPVLPGA